MQETKTEYERTASRERYRNYAESEPILVRGDEKARLLEAVKELEANHKALTEQMDYLKKNFPDEFVAVYEGRVAVHAKTWRTLINRLSPEVRTVCAIKYIWGSVS